MSLLITTVVIGRTDLRAPNPEGTGRVLYSQAYVLVQQSVLVRADAPLDSINELDRPDRLRLINEMLAEMRSSGFLATLSHAAGLKASRRPILGNDDDPGPIVDLAPIADSDNAAIADSEVIA